MADRRTTVEEMGKKAVYTLASTIQGGARPVTAEDAAQQRTVATSHTKGVVSLRYAPRTPKPSEPVSTDS